MKIAFFKLKQWQRDRIKNHPGLRDAQIEFVFYDHALDKDHIPSSVDFDAISIFVDSLINKEVLGKFPNLKFIATRSTGYDHIDIEACKERSIAVSYVPSYGENTVAEHTFALILTLSRKIYDAYHRVREEGSFNLEGLQGFDLKGKTLGIIGTGNIGRNVVKIAKGFGMEVVAADVHPDEQFSREFGFSYCSLEELLKKSDIVTLHVPYMESTHHLINKNNIALMKQGAYLINTSRGPVVETEALVQALKEKRLGGAGLDVLEEEGIVKDELTFLLSGRTEEHNLRAALAGHILIDFPNVIVTPHNAFNTIEAISRILDVTAENIVSFIKGEPINVVK